MKKYKIINYGCDDTTEDFFELTDDQYEFLRSIFEKLNKQSSYGCMPTIHIFPEEREANEYL